MAAAKERPALALSRSFFAVLYCEFMTVARIMGCERCTNFKGELRRSDRNAPVLNGRSRLLTRELLEIAAALEL